MELTVRAAHPAFTSRLSGIKFVKLDKVAIDCSFAHVSTIFGLKFISSLKHRHSRMFLAGTQ
jgi:hypothetical protein